MKIVRGSIREGVADKYAERHFHVLDPDSEFEQKYKAQEIKNKEEIVGRLFNYNDKCSIIKNPKNPENIAPYSRGVIDFHGNLFIESSPVVVHQTIIDELKGLGLISGKKLDWWLISPDVVGYLTVQKDENDIYVGESNVQTLARDDPFYSKVYSDRERLLPVFQKFLDRAKIMNPKFTFMNELIKTR